LLSQLHIHGVLPNLTKEVRTRAVGLEAPDYLILASKSFQVTLAAE